LFVLPATLPLLLLLLLSQSSAQLRVHWQAKNSIKFVDEGGQDGNTADGTDATATTATATTAAATATATAAAAAVNVDVTAS
jgi:ABC-type spermidine/putrescine transport system permease subunit II